MKACITNLYIHIRYWYQQDYFLKGLGTDVLDTPYFRSTGNGYCNFANWSSTNSNSNKIYDAMFQMVNYANQSLEGYNKEGLPWESEAQRNEAYGEIMFFRGYGYLTMGELFGGVPLVDQFYQTLKLDFVRSSREETCPIIHPKPGACQRESLTISWPKLIWHWPPSRAMTPNAYGNPSNMPTR